MADSEERLDDLSDKSSDTVDVSSSECSAASDNVSEKENLAGEIRLPTAMKEENLQR